VGLRLENGAPASLITNPSRPRSNRGPQVGIVVSVDKARIPAKPATAMGVIGFGASREDDVGVAGAQ
jgi:hypothetical protein